MKIDNYSIKARYFPAILAAVPFTVFWHYFLNDAFIEYFTFLQSIEWVPTVAIFLVVMYFLVLLGRLVWKFIFEHYIFDDEMDMPTTSLLIYSESTYSEWHIKKIWSMIKRDFWITLLSKSKQLDNIVEAKKIIVESVWQIRNKVKNGRLLLARNIEYGFWRNLIWWMPLCLVISVIWGIIAYNNWMQEPLYIFAWCSIVALLILLFSKLIMKAHWKQYAKTLFQEYMWM